jgi:hypothetical protein
MKWGISASMFLGALLTLASCGTSTGMLPQSAGTQVNLSQKNYRVLEAGAVGEDDGWSLLCIIPITSPEYALAKADLYQGIAIEGKATGLANFTEDRSSVFFLLACENRLILSADIVEFTEPARPPVASVASAPAAPPPLAASPSAVAPQVAASQRQITIAYEEAKLDDADVSRLRAWHEFAQEHPDVSRELGSRPSRLTDSEYLKKHPQLDAFLTLHPDVREAMVADPGNFVVPAR